MIVLIGPLGQFIMILFVGSSPDIIERWPSTWILRRVLMRIQTNAGKPQFLRFCMDDC